MSDSPVDIMPITGYNFTLAMEKLFGKEIEAGNLSEDLQKLQRLEIKNKNTGQISVVKIQKIYNSLFQNHNLSSDDEEETKKDDFLIDLVYKIQSKAKAKGKTLEKLLEKYGNGKGVRARRFEKMMEAIECDLTRKE